MLFRSACRGFTAAAPHAAPARQHHRRSSEGWTGLGAFAISDEAVKSWRALKFESSEVENLIERYLQPDSKAQHMDWEYWNKTIKHKEILNW